MLIRPDNTNIKFLFFMAWLDFFKPLHFTTMKEQLSFSQKHWEIYTNSVVESLPQLQDILLKKRGLTQHEEIKKFLEPSFADLASPWEMQGMRKAVKRVCEAIAKDERIVVFGDFDTDGITATVILVRTLEQLGAQVSYRIPERNVDSHGLKKHLLDDLVERDVKLVITVDCGINDSVEVTHAKAKGLDIIVTDHHESVPKTFPHDAVAVLNPKLPNNGITYPNLAGVGVAWKLALALLETELGDDVDRLQEILDPLLEIAAIGTIADCVELLDENRIIVKFGLEKMKQTPWEGLLHLLEQTNVSLEEISEETVGFVIAPHLNAASRLGDVLVASQLFLGKSEDHSLRVSHLQKLNELRRELTEKSVQESGQQIRPGAPFQIFCDPNWKPGILGLLASRHSQQLGVPVIACTIRDDGKISASCRAPEPYSMIAGVNAVSHHLERFGGHDGAAGFLMAAENFEKIREELDKHFLEQNIGALPQRIDAWVDSELLNFDLINFLKYFAPFGAGNPAPIFGLKKVEIRAIYPMGKTGNHARFIGKLNGKELEMVAFFAEHLISEIQEGDVLDIAVTIGENEWMGERKLQLRIEDARRSFLA